VPSPAKKWGAPKPAAVPAAVPSRRGSSGPSFGERLRQQQLSAAAGGDEWDTGGGGASSSPVAKPAPVPPPAAVQKPAVVAPPPAPRTAGGGAAAAAAPADAESLKLHAQMRAQLDRLVAQLADLEEARDDLDADEYDEMRSDTLEQLHEFERQLNDSASLASTKDEMQASIRAAIGASGAQKRGAIAARSTHAGAGRQSGGGGGGGGLVFDDADDGDGSGAAGVMGAAGASVAAARRG